MRFATYSAAGEIFYGAVTDKGMIALSPDCPQWPTLRHVVEAGALGQLEDLAAGKTATHQELSLIHI